MVQSVTGYNPTVKEVATALQTAAREKAARTGINTLTLEERYAVANRLYGGGGGVVFKEGQGYSTAFPERYTTPTPSPAPTPKTPIPLPTPEQTALSQYLNEVSRQQQIAAGRPYTPQEQANVQFFEKLYPAKPNPIFEGFSFGVKNVLVKPYEQYKEMFFPSRTEQSYIQEAFTPTGTSTTATGRGTMVYGAAPLNKLSKEAQYFRERIPQESLRSELTSLDIENYRNQLQENVDIGAITPEQANKNLKLYAGIKTTEYKQQSYERNVKLIKDIFGIDTEMQTDLNKIERNLYNKNILPTSTIRPIVAGYGVAYGAGKAIYERPFDVATNLALGFGISAIGGGVGYATGSQRLLTALKIGGYGLGGVAALDIASTIYAQPDLYSKSIKTGEIAATQVVPFVLGAGAGSYTVRRITTTREFEKQVAKLPPSDRAVFEAQLQEAKELVEVQPKVKSISLKDIERIPEKAQKLIEDFLQSKKRNIIVGGSVAQRTQLYKTEIKAPSDIDLYVKGLFEKYRANLYSQQLTNILRKAGIERVSQPSEGKITIAGEKAIEFLPYKRYLRFNIEQISPFFETAGKAVTKTPEGIKVLKLSYQLQRKLVGGYLDLGRASKDLPSAQLIKESLLETKDIQGKKVKYPQPLSFGVVDLTESDLAATFDLIGGKKAIEPKLAKYPESYKYFAGLEYKSLVSPISDKGLSNYQKRIDLNVNKLIGYPSKPTPARTYIPSLPYTPTTTYRPVTPPSIFAPPTKYRPTTTRVFPPLRPPRIEIPTIPNYFTEPKGGLKIGFERRKKLRRAFPAYSVFLKRRGVFKPVGTGLSRSEAYRLGQFETLRSLARTFKVKQTGQSFIDREVSQFANLEPQLFRPYRIRKGRQIPLFQTYIQKNPIQTLSEKRLLAMARRKRF